ncbi:MAG TPA: flavin reductase family protein [Candidatus Krumholzibacteria bacterium]|nr:flavin reductase family protein [Candidatus Krumholzibacteria bacterium]
MILDPATTPRQDLYAFMIRAIAPRPIAWVSTISRQRKLNLAPYSFFNGVSSKPPAILFVCSRQDDGSKKHTLLNVEDTGQFVVNFVPEALAERMNTTATEYPHGISEFEKAGLTPVGSERVLPPRLAESPINLECELHDVMQVGGDEVGSGTIIVGRIVLVHIDDSVLTDGKLDYEKYHTIGRMGGMEYTRTRDRFTMIRKKYTPDS